MFMRTKRHEAAVEGAMKQHLWDADMLQHKQKRLDEAYTFARRVCDELHKYTNTHDWHEKLDKLVQKK